MEDAASLSDQTVASCRRAAARAGWHYRLWTASSLATSHFANSSMSQLEALHPRYPSLLHSLEAEATQTLWRYRLLWAVGGVIIDGNRRCLRDFEPLARALEVAHNSSHAPDCFAAALVLFLLCFQLVFRHFFCRILFCLMEF